MVIHDEETLTAALSLIDQEPLRYSDEFAYIVVTDPTTLERLARRAFERNDIAVVAHVGHELSMEEHAKERTKIRKARREQEKTGTQEFFREHPERVEQARKRFEKRGLL